MVFLASCYNVINGSVSHIALNSREVKIKTMGKKVNLNDLLTCNEAAQMLGVSQSRVRQMVADNELEAVKIANRNIFVRASVEVARKQREQEKRDKRGYAFIKHAPDHISRPFNEWLDEVFAGRASYYDEEFEFDGEIVNIEKLLRQLAHCTDQLGHMFASPLELERFRTVAAAVRKIRKVRNGECNNVWGWQPMEQDAATTK